MHEDGIVVPLNHRLRKLKALPGQPTGVQYAIYTKLKQPLMGNGYIVQMIDRRHVCIEAWIDGCAKVYATRSLILQVPESTPAVLLNYEGAAQGSIHVPGEQSAQSCVGKYRLAGANYAEALQCDLDLGSYGQGVQPIASFLAALWVAATIRAQL